MGGETEHEAEALVVKSEIHLDPRPGDNVIDAEELRQFDLFRRMKKAVSIEKFPGSIILRRFRQGEVIFQQGQAGGTAFYIPTAEDLVRLKALEEGKEPPANPVVDPDRNRHILSVLIIPSTKKPRPRGFFERWFGPSDKTKRSKSRQAAIPHDGPTDIDFETREAPLMEGQLFGEMSCRSFMPRSATVVARVDCSLIEFNQNVFDQVNSDKNHQEWLDEEYRRRTLDTHLRQFELFQDLSESQIQLLKDNVSLKIVPPGEVICEEGEQWSDSKPLDVFIVRNGVVQVIVNANLSVRPDDIRDWAALCRLLDESRPDQEVVTPAPAKPSIKAPTAPAAAVVAKPLSPMEKMRQSKAAATASSAESGLSNVPGSPSTEIKTTEAGAAKQSPLELMRAKQAAAVAEIAGDPPVVLTNRPQSSEGQPAPKDLPPAAKLSPMEQIRAKQAAAAAAKAAAAVGVPVEPTAVGSGDAKPVEPAVPAVKLSPMEQIRAKQAAAAAAKAAAAGVAPAEPTAVDSGDAKPVETAPIPVKLSPMEQIRAKQAAAGKTGASVVSPGDQPIGGDKSTGASGSEKPSPLDLTRAKKGGQSASSTTSGTGAKSESSETPQASRGEITPASQQPQVKELPLLRKPVANVSGPPLFIIKSWFSDHVLQAIRQLAQGELAGESLVMAQSLILNALNELTRNKDFLGEKRLISDVYSKPTILRKTASFPKGFKGISKDWSEMELRSAGRSALSEIFPEVIRRPVESAGPPRVLAYISRGECIGEIAVVRGTERNATCIAYNHPSSENPRDFGNVELVRIRGSAFRQLMADSPELKHRVQSLAEKRLKQVESGDQGETETDLIASNEFQQMGLFQGSKLLVIDLDSCTRCGDCVQACVETHDDGASRLFLDGPRYDRFLVPSACRNCLNPVCMIGCPVGSIKRGENGQIEIYDWCIGCSACADQCPYDSIQMHDLGLIPEESSGWLYANRRSLQDDWFSLRRLGNGWMQGESPFRWQGDFLRQLATEQASSSKEQPVRLCFRHEFRLPKKSRSHRYRISINDARRKGAIEKTRVKTSKVVGVWLNGKKLELSGNSIELTTEQFSTKDNVLAIEVVLESPLEYGQFVLSACLDAISEVGTQALEVLGKDVRSEMDLVTRRAAVCDLCSHTPSQQPACVSSCPHDAAIRVNPMMNFPM